DDWAEIARDADVVIVGGFAELGDRGALYDTAAVVDATGIRAVYRKTHLWDIERDVFAAGDEPPPVVEARIRRGGVAVCYDLFCPELTRGLALQAADILAVPTNSPRATTDADARDHIGVSIARAAGHVNRMFVAVCDRCGDERGRAFAGRSAIVDPDGE